jgi:hypothetical protein
MTATRLSTYNGALLLMGERRLTELDDPAEEQSQIELDTAWDNGAVDYCLEQALWNFATRTIELTYDPDSTPEFGLTYAFNKPTDWIRTAAFCSDGHFTDPILGYKDKGEFWYCDLQTVYIEYISNDNSYGNDLSLWPQTFRKVVEAFLATETCERITQSRVKRADMEAKYFRRLFDASAKDAINQATQFPVAGNWVRARGGGYGGQRRGNR